MARPVPLLAIACCLPGCLALILHGVSVPGLGFRGEVAYLKCNYEEDVENSEDIVNVTWFKDGIEFYHSTNMGLESNITVKEVPGVEVDKYDSGYRSLTLKSLKVNSGGEYHCAASSPSGRVVSERKPMLVVAPPESDPVITGLAEGIWVPNGTLQLNCTAAKSFPAANLTWLVRGEEADEDRLIPWPTEQDEEGLETSILGLNLQLGPDPRTETVEVTCESVVKKRVVEIGEQSASSTDLHYRNTVSKTVRSGAAQATGQLTAVLLMLLACWVATALTN